MEKPKKLLRLTGKNKKEAERILNSLLLWLKEVKKEISNTK